MEERFGLGHLERRYNLLIIDEVNHATGRRLYVEPEDIKKFLALTDIRFDGHPTYGFSIQDSLKILEVAPELEGYALSIEKKLQKSKEKEVIPEKCLFRVDFLNIQMAGNDMRVSTFIVNNNARGDGPMYRRLHLYDRPFYKIDEYLNEKLKKEE